jgi:simple sugar transport system substrate-binding protein
MQVQRGGAHIHNRREPDMTDTLDPSRRRALAQLSVGSLTTLAPWALSTSFAQAKPLTVGVIYVGPRDDFGYNQAQAQAAAESQEAARRQGGRGRERPRDDGGAEDDDRHDRAGRREGLFPTSFGYFDPHVLAIAPKIPTSASRTAAACGPRRTRRTRAATSATSRSAST